MATGVKQANFTLPEDLLKELRETVPKGEQSKGRGRLSARCASPLARNGSVVDEQVILDTDVLSDLLRDDEAIRALLGEVMAYSVPCCSVISVAEIHAGMRPEERELTADLLDGLVIFPVTPSAKIARRW